MRKFNTLGASHGFFDLTIFLAYVLFTRMQPSSHIEKNPYKQKQPKIWKHRDRALHWCLRLAIKKLRLFSWDYHWSGHSIIVLLVEHWYSRIDTGVLLLGNWYQSMYTSCRALFSEVWSGVGHFSSTIFLSCMCLVRKQQGKMMEAKGIRISSEGSSCYLWL